MDMFSLVPWKRKRKEEGNGGAIATPESNPLVRFREEVDALFDRFFRDGPGFDRPWKGWPAVTGEGRSLGRGFEVDDRENEIVVRAEAPGPLLAGKICHVDSPHRLHPGHV
jgi:hypothetical protein